MSATELSPPAIQTLQVLTVLVLAPALSGAIAQIEARWQGRRGPRILQPYYDLAKLFRKETLVPNDASMVFTAGLRRTSLTCPSSCSWSWLSSPPCSKEVHLFRRIMVGFDGSLASREALHTAIALAARISGEVDVVAVVPPRSGEVLPALLRAAADELGPDPGMGVTYAVTCVEGARPAEILAAHCDERGFDLLVLGRHGQDCSSEGRLGPVAHQLVERGRIPVLVVGEGTAQQ